MVNVSLPPEEFWMPEIWESPALSSSQGGFSIKKSHRVTEAVRKVLLVVLEGLDSSPPLFGYVTLGKSIRLSKPDKHEVPGWLN